MYERHLKQEGSGVEFLARISNTLCLHIKVITIIIKALADSYTTKIVKGR